MTDTTTIEGAEEFDFSADFFDSRDVIARIAYLEGMEENGETDQDEEHPDNLSADEREELADLRKLQEAAQGYIADWQYGETFISDSYFETYAEELAADIGAIDCNASWPLNRIDWEAAAADLQQDYTSFEVRGQTYWAR